MGPRETLAGRACAVLRRAGAEDSYAAPLVRAAQARAAAHRGDGPAARQQLADAEQLLPALTGAIAHLAIQARIELARAHIALADTAAAGTLLREVDELLRRWPSTGTLAADAEDLRTRLGTEREAGNPRATTLTGAELRLLPLLTTHLSFPQIGAELYLSPHTIKSQAVSIYRKLAASTRSQAVTRARELGLVEADSQVVHRLFTLSGR